MKVGNLIWSLSRFTFANLRTKHPCKCSVSRTNKYTKINNSFRSNLIVKILFLFLVLGRKITRKPR